MSSNNSSGPASPGLAGRVARGFVDSKLTPLLVVASVLLGLAAVILLPREEEPQIKVPMIDVTVAMAGASAREVEALVASPMEKVLWEIPGVEYLYSTSSEGQCLVIVRFEVGSDPQRSLHAVSAKLDAHWHGMAPGVGVPTIEPRSIDDVPILALTFHSRTYDHEMLRRVALEVDDVVKRTPFVAETSILGGARRQVRVSLDPARLSASGLGFQDVVMALRQANQQARVGRVTFRQREIVMEGGGFLHSAGEVEALVVGTDGERAVRLRDVARVSERAEEPDQYVFFGHGRASLPESVDAAEVPEEAAVTLTVAKRPGANAIAVAEEVLRRVEAKRGYLLPREISMTVTRHYGETASEKSNELLFHMAIAVVGVSLLVLFVLGWRESMIVALAIPSTLALTLLIFYLYGFTLNRITLFALIFSIGILVDDAIVVVENLVRHFHLARNRGRAWTEIAVEAVGEVGNPTILATWAVIAAVLPMAFVGGLMGPYMRPIPIGASAAMLFSLAIAFVVTPWASVRVLRWGRKYSRLTEGTEGGEGDRSSPGPSEAHSEDWLTRVYRRWMNPLLGHRAWRIGFLAAIVLLLLGAVATVGLGWVQVKMLPFDNKSEFQVILNLPEGTPLETTVQAAREMAAAIRQEPEVTDYQIYAGRSAPYNFNGLVRHYYLRRGPHVADLQVNLVAKGERQAQSHAIAKRVRPALAAIAERYEARIAVAEVPPGPPVLQTLVAEIYGPGESNRLALARRVIEVFEETPGVVDTDWYFESDQPEIRWVVERSKAALHGISAETVVDTLQLAVDGRHIGLIHRPGEKEGLALRVELPRAARAVPEQLLGLRLPSPRDGALVPMRELVMLETNRADRSIYHKNLMPVTYVIGDVAGQVESPVYAIAQMSRALERLDTRLYGGDGSPLSIHHASMPETDLVPALKWDGEWHITIEVFRDLGVAFGAVLILIYALMVGWFRSFVTPLIVMAAIPFSLVGILPAHGLMGAFFTATSMIGFMAGAGIVVRNSIILVDFIELRLAEGMPLKDAVVDAGAVRFRPMLLTAMAVVVGAAVILFDPIFQGLALSLMAGEVASLFISRMAVPVLYYMVHR